jgi:hypothetical protein
MTQDYLSDIPVMRRGVIEDGVLEFDGKLSPNRNTRKTSWINPLRVALGRA